MRIDDFSLAFNCPGCPSWGTAIVNQDTKKVHLIKKDVASNIVIGMMHKCVTLNTHDFSLPIGKGSRIYYGNTGFDEATSEPMLVSVFDKVFINSIQIPASFVMTIIRDKAEAHKGRLQIKYTPKLKYGAISNEDFFREAIKCLHLSKETPWVIYDIDIAGQEELHFKALIGSDVKDLEHQMRNLPQIEDVEVADHTDILSTPIEPTDETTELDSREYAYMAAIKTKPFLILGGFSGTGKSLLVKSLAFTTCPCDGVLNTSETSPGNYLLVSVKPNWHDATDITGFRSSVNRNYYVTDFMRFLVKAKLHPNVPFFVCLDEMNLAPVEEYFADFLSVIESRKRKKDGTIVTDAIVPASVFNDKDYADDFDVFLKIGLKPINEVKDITEFTAKVKESDSDESEFFEQSWLVEELKRDGLTIPQNVIIIGTVNMDDTTNSFSRKVIDRAMTFETIVGTFDSSYFDSDVTLGYVKNYRKGDLFISDEVRATEMMEDGRFTLSDEEKNRIIGFINDINSDMEGTPFKISYRILNETILLYRAKQKIVELMGEEEENDGVEINTDLNSIFDDVLMQKVLPRIEGDFEKCDKCLVKLGDRAERMEWKQSSEKIEFMIKRFGKDHSGFTSFWN
ncbi:MAG: hypothetical protein UE783_02925 [Prevotella sp.]|nr:hypothetical protein [Prevotella sp.]